MTIASTINRVTYTGNGTTTNFSVPYLFLANTDLRVYQNGVLKTLTTHYTVSGAGNPAGGTVTFLTAPASGDGIVILNDPPITQTLDLEDNDALPAEPVERAFDRLTIIAQRLSDRLNRAAVLPDSYAGSASPVLPVPVAGRALKWNGTATALVNSDNDPDAVVATAQSHAGAAAASATAAANSATAAAASYDSFDDRYLGAKASDPATDNDGQPLLTGALYWNTTTGAMRVYTGAAWEELTAGTILVQNFSGNGSQTVFTLNAAPSDENNTQVYISGVYQQKNTYSVSGTTLTFSVAPPAGTNNIEVVTISTRAIGVLGENVVGTPQMQGKSVTLAKLADDALLTGFRNKLINSGFVVNQRGYVNGTAVGAANTYTRDRWRVVTSGQSVTFSGSGPFLTATAPAGGLEQVIPGEEIEGGVYTLSWTGTATATVNGVSITNGGQTASLPAGTNVTVRFSNGTVAKPQFELGSRATQHEVRPRSLEELCCRRFYRRMNTPWHSGYVVTSGFYTSTYVPLDPPMRVTPTVTVLLQPALTNAGSASAIGAQVSGFAYALVANANNVTCSGSSDGVIEVNAEL